MNLENGYETIINEDGTNISQSLRQQICVARMLATERKIVLLDDVTRTIQTVHVQKMVDTIIEYLKNKTAIIICYRISFLKKVDEIIVFDGENIVDRGSYDELMAKKGYFYHYIVKDEII